MLSRVSGLVALLGLSLLVACSDSDDAGKSASATEDGSLAEGAFDPIDGMATSSDQAPISGAEEVVIFRAQQRLVGQCMADQGFDTVSGQYQGPVKTKAPPFLSPVELRRSSYQFDWDAAAEEFLALNGPAGPPNPTAGMTEEEIEAYGKALDGGTSAKVVQMKDLDGGTVSVSTEGCRGEAAIRLYGSAENSIRFNRAAEQVTGFGFSKKLFQKNAYRAVAETWQECMEKAGYDVGPITDASGKKSNGFDYGLGYLTARQATQLSAGQGPLGQVEIDAVATADADCQESSGLYELRQELLPEAKDEVTDELGLEMSQYVAFQHAVLERAKNVP
jgi:hypothetical protein